MRQRRDAAPTTPTAEQARPSAPKERSGSGAGGRDVAWSFVAGQDPMDTIRRYRDRIAAAHVKDRAPDGENTDEDGWADLGDGRVDWPACLTALKSAGCTNFVLEHDNPSDDQRFARRSLAYLNSLEG